MYALSHTHMSRHTVALISNKNINLTHILGERAMTIYSRVIILSNHSKARNKISAHKTSKRKGVGD